MAQHSMTVRLFQHNLVVDKERTAMSVSEIGQDGMNLGVGFLSGLRRSAGIESRERGIEKCVSPLTRAKMEMALKHSDTLYITPIGRGVHRPYKVRLKNNLSEDIIDCSEVVFKTVHCQYETKRYCKAVDLSITGPERELLAYDLDKAAGFDLIPPTVGRYVDELGYGSVMAWVRAPLGVDWVKSKEYRYKEHPENPWLHRCAAFDFITGQIDRHAANWILDKSYRVYAIDNGYSFVKGDDRRFLKCNIGKYLVGKPVHPEVRNLVCGIDENSVWKVLQNRGFKFKEPEGVMKRLEEMKKLTTWEVMGDLWDPNLKRR
jgi:hypothetical protein